MKIGIRLEDKSVWERRVPFVPADIKELRKQGIDIVVQSSRQRAFTDKEFLQENIPVQDNLKDCNMIFGIKEIPKHVFEHDKIYIFFAHVIKGQKYNMPMLKSMMDKKATLFDYERVMDDANMRLIFFGRHAGIAGMINSLWSLGQKLKIEGIDSPFSILEQMRTYFNLKQAENIVKQIGQNIKTKGLVDTIHPVIIGITGYGNVSKGAQEILDLLPVKQIMPEDVPKIAADKSISNKVIYKAVFKEGHCVQNKDTNLNFNLEHYYKYGNIKYKNKFDSYVEYLTMLVNCVYWDNRYPRLLTLEKCRQMWTKGAKPRLFVIGDISCDINGAVECTVKACDPGKPVYVYHPDSGKLTYGFKGYGPVIMAVDILPTEIPRESSIYFSSILKKFIPSFVNADYSVPFENLHIMPELKRSIILYHGKLTPEYEYLDKFL